MQTFNSFITRPHNSICYCFSYNELNVINLSNTMEMLNVKVLPKKQNCPCPHRKGTQLHTLNRRLGGPHSWSEHFGGKENLLPQLR
jgi:hypothetical protein